MKPASPAPPLEPFEAAYVAELRRLYEGLTREELIDLLVSRREVTADLFHEVQMVVAIVGNALIPSMKEALSRASARGPIHEAAWQAASKRVGKK